MDGRAAWERNLKTGLPNGNPVFEFPWVRAGNVAEMGWDLPHSDRQTEAGKDFEGVCRSTAKVSYRCIEHLEMRK
jgi:hypothetical protein